MSIRGFHHVAISTPDLKRALAFWCDHLGFSVVRQWSWGDVAVVDSLTGLEHSAADAALLAGHGTRVELFEFSSPPQSETTRPGDRPVSDHGYTHVCLEVDDLETDIERLSAAGMTFWADPVTDQRGTRLVYGRDPDGNVIEFTQPASESSGG